MCVDQSTGFGRQALRGIGQWVRRHGGWSLIACGPGAGQMATEWLAGQPVHGIVVDGVAVPEPLVRKRVPKVMLGHGTAAAGARGIHADDEAIGCLAADHLCDQGLRRLVCCGDGTRATDLRRTGFTERAKQRGCSAECREVSSLQSLAEWLRALPAPAGVMACDDRLALAVLDACRETGIRVPEDVSVIGVGNDDVLCELSSPGLTSVAPDAVRMGFLAAETLAAALAGDRDALARRITVPPVGIEIRGTTETLSTADPELRPALRLIRERACSGLTIDDLSDATLLTRRTLERRFQKELGRSIHDEILRVRIAAARRALVESDAKLVTVAAESGFADVAALCHAFKRVTGERPGDFRRLHRG